MYPIIILSGLWSPNGTVVVAAERWYCRNVWSGAVHVYATAASKLNCKCDAFFANL
jgi:hypothetical protein